MNRFRDNLENIAKVVLVARSFFVSRISIFAFAIRSIKTGNALRAFPVFDTRLSRHVPRSGLGNFKQNIPHQTGAGQRPAPARFLLQLSVLCAALLSLAFFIQPTGVQAKEIMVDATSAATNANTNVGSPTAVWTTDQIGYVFYLGVEGDLEMASTTDGGATWQVRDRMDSVNTTDVVSYAIWWDGWTAPGTTTQYIHIATTDTSTDDIYYTRLDTTNQATSTTVVTTTQAATCTSGASCFVSIAKASNDALYVATSDGQDSWVDRCITTCTSTVNWSELTGAYYNPGGDDYPYLMPIVGSNNMMLAYWDVSASALYYNVYSATSSAWIWSGSATQTIGSAKDTTTTYEGQVMGMAYSTTTGLMGLALVDDANNYTAADHDINFYTYSSSTGWTARTDVITNDPGALTAAKVSYDAVNDTWYVIYGRRAAIGTSATAANIYYKISRDNGVTWSPESLAAQIPADDINGITTGIVSRDRIGVWWNYSTAPRADREYYALITDLSPNGSLTLSGTLYSDEGVTPITSGESVTAVVGTSTRSIHTTTTDSSGRYSIIIDASNTATTSTPIVVYVNGNASVRAVTITEARDGTSNIADLDLYEDRVLITHENLATLKVGITDMATYDSTDDGDIQYTASSTRGTLTVASGQKLMVDAGRNFTAGGNVTLPGDFYAATSSTVVAPGSFTLSGNFASNGAYHASSTWVARRHASTSAYYGVAYGNGTFVAVGAGAVMRSVDGITWATSTPAEANNWRAITYGNGLFVAVASGGTNRVMTSPDGITWTAQSAAEANSWYGVTYGNGLFVAVGEIGSGSNLVMTSPDGVSWTAQSGFSTAGRWESVTYGSGTFVAIDNYGNGNVMTSPDGVNWTARTLPVDFGGDNWESVTYGGGLFVAVSYFGPIITSPDGVTWTERLSTTVDGWRGVGYGNGLYVAVGNSGSLAVSFDGITWNERTPAEANNWYSVTYGNGLFVAVSITGTNRVMTSVGGDSHLFLNGTSAQTATGTFMISSQLRNVTLSGAGTKTFLTNASTTNFTIASTSGTVTLPTAFAVSESFTNNATLSHNNGTVYFSATSTASGTLTGTSALNHVVIGGVAGTKTFITNASTSNFTVRSGATVIAPEKLTLSGNFAQNGIYHGTTRWLSASSSEAANQWTSITYGNGLFVAVSANGTNQVMTSPDGITWTPRSAAEANAWYSVTYGNGLFVAVAYTGTNRVMTSPDGITWSPQSAAEANQWYSVTYGLPAGQTGNGLFVAVSIDGTNRVMTSPDGITWSPQSAAEANQWASVTYGNGLFVAVSADGANQVMTSPDGATWTARAEAQANEWQSVTYGNGLFVAVSWNGTNRVMTSPNGTTWTVRSAADTSQWRGVTYGNGLFVAVACGYNGSACNSTTGGNRLMTSSDGVTWVARSGAGDNLWVSAAYGNGTFVAVSYQSFDVVMTSRDSTTTISSSTAQTISGTLNSGTLRNVVFEGVGEKRFVNNASTTNVVVNSGATVIAPANLTIAGNFTNSGNFQSLGSSTARTAAKLNTWNSVTYGNGLFVAVSATTTAGTSVMTSPDGTTWTSRTAPEANSWASVTYGNGRFVAVSSDGTNRVMTSLNGFTWSPQSAAEANIWQSVTYGNGTFVAVARDGTNQVMTSPDGIIWTARPDDTGEAEMWRSVTYGNGLFVAVASINGTTYQVMTSPDGITWTGRSAPTNRSWNSVTYGNGLFVAVETDAYTTNQVMTSPDGITWTSRSAVAAQSWNSVTYGNGLFVAVSSAATTTTNAAMTSSDGIVWTARATAGATSSNSVTYGNGTFVAVGAVGTSRVMTLADATTTFNGAGDQSISGTLNSATLRNVAFTESGTTTFATNASTTHFTIASTSGRVVAPSELTIAGNYSNRGTFVAGTGTTTFNGSFAQVATGTLSATSSFYNLEIKNGTSTTFTNAFTVSNFFKASTTGTVLALASGATSTFATANIIGTSGNEIKIRSSVDGSTHNIVITGAYAVTYADIKDSAACGSTGGGLTATSSIYYLGNTCWTFGGESSQGGGLLLSGTLYSDEGGTPITATIALGVAIGTSTLSVHATTSLNTGAWNITIPGGHTIDASTPILIWTDNDPATRAALFTKAKDANNISNLDLYQDRVIVSTENTQGDRVTLADMDFYDNTDDTDIQYNAATTTGLIVNSGNELHIKTEKAFAPEALVTIHGNAGSGTDGSLHLTASSTYAAGGITRIAGNLSASSSAIFATYEHGTIFTATTSGKTINTAFASIGSTTFSGTGTWTFTNNATTTDFTINSGATVVAPAQLTLAGDLTQSGTFTAPTTLTLHGAWGDSDAGTVNVSHDGTSGDVVNATALAPDGSLYVAGYYYNVTNSDADWRIRKYDANGDLATGWGDSDSGTINITSNDAGGGDLASDLVLAPDGSLYVVGYYYNDPYIDYDWRIQKYDANGDLATGWGDSDSGTINVSHDGTSGNGDAAYALVLAPDGSLYVAGSYYNVANADQDWRIQKYDANGDLATGWGDSDSGTVNVSNNDGSDSANALALSPDGSLYVAGYYYNVTNSDADWRIQKYDANGDLATGWGDSDSGTINVSHDGTSGNGDTANATALAPDGSLYVAGYYYDNVNADNDWRIQKYTAGGDLATGWGDSDSGMVNVSNNDGSDSANALALSPDGSLYVAGYYYNVTNSDADWRIRKYDANGDLATGWGDSDSGTINVSHDGTGGNGDTANATALAPDGSLYVAGSYYNAGNADTDWRIQKYDASGDLATGAKTLTGTMVGTSALNDVAIYGASTTTFMNNASTSNFTVNSGATVIAPANLTIAGNYTNSGTTTFGTGTTTFNGTSLQIATGTLSGTSAFYNLEVLNNTGTTTFGSTLTVSNFFKATQPGTQLAFAAGATSTFAIANIIGTSGNEITIRSSADGSTHNIVVTGAYVVTYADIKNSAACGSTGGGLTATSSTDSTGNTCWIFSAGEPPANLLLSGTLYSDEGGTPITALVPLGIAIGTSTLSVHATTSLASGAWNVTIPDGHTIGTSTPILIWTDNDPALRAALFTKASSTNNISGLNLYQNRVIISHEGTSGTSTTNANMSFYDGDDDSDIQYTSNGGALTINQNQELHIGTGKTYEPGGTVTINGNASTSPTDGTFHLPGTATYTAGGNTSLAGSFNASSTATFTPGAYTTTFTATTSGKNILAPLATLGATSFNGANGVWTFATSATTTTFTTAAGTVIAPANLTISGNFQNLGSFQGVATATARTASEANTWQSVTYGNGLFVAVSSDGTNRIMTSPDGITWSPQSAAEANQWTSVTYGNGRFVAVAQDGTNRVMTSPDGITWSPQSAAEANWWVSVTYGNGLFVAVAIDGTNRVMTSSDGITWSPKSAAEANSWYSITYGNGLFVAVAYNGTNRVMTSPDGITWTPRSAAEANQWYSVTYGNGLFVAVSSDGTNRVMTSPDGITWTARSASEANQWRSVTYGNGIFVAVSDSGTNRVMTSPDGIIWTPRAASEANFWQSIIYGNGRFVAVAQDGTNRVMTMQDSTTTFSGASAQSISGTMNSATLRNVAFSGAGTKTFSQNASTSNVTVNSGATVIAPGNLTIAGNFQNSGNFQGVASATPRAASEANQWVSVTYGNGLFVAVAIDGTNRVMTSSDGITWSPKSAAEANSWYSITYGNGLFVAVSFNGTNRVMTSPDGITWTARAAAEANLWQSVTYGNGLFVAVAYNGTNRVMTSPDGITWTPRSVAANNWSSITYGNGLFVAVAYNGTNRVMTSPDGIIWTPRAASEANSWQSVTYGNGIFVAVSDSGTNRVMTSPDGITWTARAAAQANAWSSVTYGSGLFFAVPSDGTSQVMTSPDGITWTARAVSETNWWYSVTYGNGLFVAVSFNGTNRVMTLADSTTTFNGASDQTISGTLNSATLRNVAFTESGTTTIASNASTTNFTIASTSGRVVAPPLLTISGNYSNLGTFIAGSGTTTFNGNATQTLSGTMTGTSSFNNLEVTNTSGNGTTTQSINFTASASTTDTFRMHASTSARFLANATSTFQNAYLGGLVNKYVYLRSSIPGTPYGFYVPGTQRNVSYVNVKDSSACPSTILANDGTSIDSGNNTCWTFAAAGNATISSDDNQTFPYQGAATTISTITITDHSTPTITASNNLRIIIATTTVDMRWDTTDTTATLGGTASAKVSPTVTYENGGATLVLDVTNDFAAGETLTIGGLAYTDFNTVVAPAVALGVRTAGAGLATANSDSKTVAITGAATLANHSAGQVGNEFDSANQTGVTLFAFRLSSAGETANIASTVFTLSGVSQLVTGDFTNFALYRDMNGDQTYDGGDIAVGGSGAVSISGQTGTITFSSAWTATTTLRDYILVGDVANITGKSSVTMRLLASGITATGATTVTAMNPQGSVSGVQHIKNARGGGGSSAAVGGDAPAGDGIVFGGDAGGGGGVNPDVGGGIGNEVDFNPPASNGTPLGAWTSGANAYSSDGVYTTTTGIGAQHTYGTFNFSVPTNNTISGITVKLESSASTAEGTISARLSWNNGANSTELKTTATLTQTDAVYELGSPSDAWGHAWTPSEMQNGNFTLEIVANPGNGNTIRVDAIQVRVFHQSTGGGGGGGGAVFKQPDQYFANVYTGSSHRFMRFLEWLWGWVF